MLVFVGILGICIMPKQEMPQFTIRQGACVAVEITPLYGVQGNDKNDIPYLSPKWMDMLKFVEKENKRQHIWNTDWARYTGSILPMSFAEKDYTHGIDLITIEHGEEEEGKETDKSKEWKVDFLEYKPQHALRILPEDEEELTFKKWQKLINSELSERTDGELSDHFDYVMLKVKQEKLSSDDIKELEKLVNEKDAVLCKIQRIIPQLDLSTIQGSQHITSIEDIINRPPLDTLKEAFAIRRLTNYLENPIKRILWVA